MIFYIPLPFLSLAMIFEIGRIYHPITKSYVWNPSIATLTGIIFPCVYIIIIELIKKAILYIIVGNKEENEKEVK